MKTISTLFLLHLTMMLMSQTSILQNYFENVTEHTSPHLSKTDMESLISNEQIVDQMGMYLSDSISHKPAVSLLGRIGHQHNNPSVRQQVVHQLLDAAAGKYPPMSTIVDQLESYKRQDFDEAALGKVDALLQSKPTHIKNWVLIAGFLSREEALQSIQADYKNNKKIYRNIGFALARCGDQRKINGLMNSIITVPVNDQFVYDLTPMLLYVRQKAVFDYLLEQIENPVKNCNRSGDGRSGKIQCAYRLMEMVAPYIIDFPIETDEYGDPINEDYRSTLDKTRIWITRNKSSYKLNTDIY